jgi:hypothetical protein
MALSDEQRCPEELVVITGTVEGKPRQAWRCSLAIHGESTHCADFIAPSGQVYSVYWEGPTPQFSQASVVSHGDRRLPPPRISR